MPNENGQPLSIEDAFRLQAIVEAIADPVFVKDREHCWIYLNDAFCEFMGHRREELLGKSDYDFFPSLQADVFWTKDEAVFESGKENSNEEKFTDAKGREHTIVTKKTVFRDRDGSLILVGVIRDITETKNIEEDLKHQQEQQRLLLDSTAEAIYGIDLQGNCTFCNAAFLKKMGYASERDVLGKNMHKAIHHTYADGKEYPVERCRIFQAFKNGAGSHVDNEVLWRADGTSIAAEYWSYPQWKDGKVVGAVVTFIDITARKKAEEADRIQSAIYRNLSEGVYMIRLQDGLIVEANRKFESMFGYAPGELTGKPVAIVNAPAEHSPQKTAEDITAILREKGEWHGEVLNVKKDGTRFWCNANASLFNHPEYGEVIVAVHTDITELKQIRDKLALEAANARKFLQAVEASPIATIITTTEPAIIYINPAWEKLTGYSKEEAMGKNPRILQSGKTPRDLYPVLWKTILGNETFHADTIINRRKNGTEFNADLSIYPLLENGKVQFFVGMQFDITEQKRTDRSKAEFVSLASHQLRTPLTGIRWGITMLGKKGQLNPIQADILTEMDKAAGHMAESIDVMLHLSRIESGKMIVKNEMVDIDAFIAELCSQFHPLAEAKHMVCALHPDPGIRIKTDPALLREILGNLITNAIKYSPDGRTVSLSAKIIGNTLRISLADAGYGIPADQQHLVFSRFFRGMNVVAKIPDGTGLGLYLVYALVGLLGGTITFVSAENQGTTFTLTLPLSPPAPSLPILP